MAIRAILINLSVLFNEPKLLKFPQQSERHDVHQSFSALQRAEIAEIFLIRNRLECTASAFSALQRAEIAEMIVTFKRCT